MSTTTDPRGAAEEHAPGEHRDEGHPDEKQYFVVALVLAVLTAIEVALYYVEGLDDNVLVVMLGVLAVAKFVGVVAWFMHLKFDSRIFRNIFVTGLLLAIAVYLAALAAMGVFGRDPSGSTAPS